jgi:hypothetical protein
MDENNQAVDGIASLLDALNNLDAGGHAVLPGDRDASGERIFQITDSPKANDPGPLDESIDGMDQDQLQAFGIPPKTVMEGGSVDAIKKVRNFRNDTKLPLYFSLDAGPNLHLLYPDSIAAQVKPFIKEELSKFCESGRVIEDRVGKGAVEI